MALAATGLIDLSRTNQDDRIIESRRPALYQTLRSAGFFTAHHTYRVQLVNILRTGHDFRHGPKRQAAKIQVQSGTYHPLAHLGKLFTDFDDARVEELNLIDADDVGRGIDRGDDVGRQTHRLGLEVQPVVRGNLFNVVTGID